MIRVDVAKLVTCDLDKHLKSAKTKKILSAMCMPIGFAMFGGGVPLSILVSAYCAVIPVIGFILLPLGATMLSKFYTKELQLNQIVFIRDAIKQQEKLFIFQIGVGEIEVQTLSLVTKLIEVGELKGYKIVNNIAIVREEMFVSQESIMREYMMLRFGRTDVDNDIEISKTKECSYCHKAVPNDANFCSNCGARLNN